MAITYATWNPADKSAEVTLTEGNLKAAVGSISNNHSVRSTVGKQAGKFYWEIVSGTAGAGRFSIHIGIATAAFDLTSRNLGGDTNGYGYYGLDSYLQGQYYYNGAVTSGHPGWVATDIIMVAFDIDNGNLWYGVNGVWNEGNPATGDTPSFSGIAAETWHACVALKESGYVTAVFDPASFTYSAPSGFSELAESQIIMDAELPALTADMVAGAKFDADFPALEMLGILRSSRIEIFESTIQLESPEIAIETQPHSGIDMEATFPALEMQMVAGAKLGVTLPALTFEAGATVKTRVAFAATFPALKMSAKTGALFSADFPALTMAATAEKTEVLSLAATFPALKMSATAYQSLLADFAANFRVLQMEATALQGRVITMDADFPALEMAVNAWHELTCDLDADFPALTLAILAQQTGRFDPTSDLEPTYVLQYSRDRTGCSE